MEIIDDVYNRVVDEMSIEDAIKGLLFIKSKQESEIESIKYKIHKYEKKRSAEEAWYQSLSPLKRFFTGHAPSHHKAVEHLVNVKDRYIKIETIKRKIASLDEIISILEADPEKRELHLPSGIIKEMIASQKDEGPPR
ncbi:hypothetical protein GW626_02060 [Peribacillus muralis]|uniref:hypothetical protein n=1 Tax=Peribacillus muralis TaxID=264697 RepID=UPI001F4D8B77|nr:hypothetical protein [Peribacillus muralis]MCK1994142.1 hypothetical protein [Peribacillus muralis]MCK2014697.1 hypothetical protein [Peribacillus muralis]